MLNRFIRRLMTTTTQEDIKLLDEVLIRKLRVDINDPKLHEKFKESLKKKTCSKCEEVKNIVNAKAIFRMEQNENINII
jgi:hypothetical protein